MKKAILVAIIGALTVSVNAGGSWGGKAPVSEKAVVETCSDIGGEVSVGYHSDLYLYGRQLSSSVVSLAASYTVDAFVPLTIGVAHYDGHLTPIGGLNELTAVSATTSLGSFGGFDASLGYTHYFTHSGVNSWGDIGLGLSRDLGFAELVLGTNYGVGGTEIGNGGWNHHIGLVKSIGLTDSLSVVLSGTIGYHDEYFNGFPVSNNSWSYYNVNASLPIALNCRATITPYIGYYGVQQWNAWPGQGDDLVGGVTLNVKF